MSTQTTLPAKKEAAPVLAATAATTLKDLILNSDMSRRVKRALPRGMDLDSWWQALRTYIDKTPKLADCTMESIYTGMLEIAGTGLIIGGALQEAWLVPFEKRNARVHIAQVIYGYKGLIKLAVRSGAVRAVRPVAVYAKDVWRYEEGLNPVLEHIPSNDPNPGEIIAAYAIAVLPDGQRDHEVMLKPALDKIKRAAKGADREGSAYHEWPEMQARKAPVRRLCSRLPKATDSRFDAAAAVARETDGLKALGRYDQVDMIGAAGAAPALPESEAEGSPAPTGDRQALETRALDLLSALERKPSGATWTATVAAAGARAGAAVPTPVSGLAKLTDAVLVEVIRELETEVK